MDANLVFSRRRSRRCESERPAVDCDTRCDSEIFGRCLESSIGADPICFLPIFFRGDCETSGAAPVPESWTSSSCSMIASSSMSSSTEIFVLLPAGNGSGGVTRGRYRCVAPRLHEHGEVAVARELPVPFFVHALEHGVEKVAFAPRGRQRRAVLCFHHVRHGGSHATFHSRRKSANAFFWIHEPGVFGVAGPRRREVRVAVEPAYERDDVFVRWELRDGTRALGFLQRGAAL